ncbi:MAG: hypothetical protein HKN12_04695, partial [Gemmatimonadetes bacterium]|nr:hypothetical protein [Gemmatimonadota bacterium]
MTADGKSTREGVTPERRSGSATPAGPSPEIFTREPLTPGSAGLHAGDGPDLAAMSGDASRTAERVVYITGYGRSGSTLLDILIGQADGVTGVGELDLLHRDWGERGCSCGKDYDDCEFWSAVETSRLATLTEAVAREQGRAMPDRGAAAAERTLRRVENLPSFPALVLNLL